MKREDFIFTIGYRDDQAIVDKRSRAKYGKMSTLELQDEGLHKPAAISALYALSQGEEQEARELFDILTREAGREIGAEQLARMYGISPDFDSSLKMILS